MEDLWLGHAREFHALPGGVGEKTPKPTNAEISRRFVASQSVNVQ